MRLKNGSLMVEQRPLPERPGHQSAAIVLARLDHNRHTPWATWQMNTENGATYWGHYFENEPQARRDFATRGR